VRPTTSADALDLKIAIHEAYGKRDIVEWIIGQVDPQAEEIGLDLGCGTGKQIVPMSSRVGSGYVVGVDNDPEKADSVDITDGRMTVIIGSMDDVGRLVREHTPFDFAYSCFALYEAEDPAAVVGSVYEMLGGNGRLFVCGP